MSGSTGVRTPDDEVVARLRAGAPALVEPSFAGTGVLVRARRRVRRRRALVVLGSGVLVVVLGLLVVGPLPAPGGRTFVMPGSAQVRSAIAHVVPVPDVPVHRPSLAEMTPGRMSSEVAALEADVLPVVQELGVTFWDDQVGCELIEYGRGAFAAGGGWWCRFGDGGEQPQDETAAADFARVRDAIAGTGVPVNQVIVPVAGSAGADGVYFELSAEPWAWSWAYVYLPEGEPTESEDADVPVTYTPVAEHWWFQQFPD